LLHAYKEAVAEAFPNRLASLMEKDPERKLETPIGKPSIGEIFTAFTIRHINAHSGETAAWKGCLGVKGYPFLIRRIYLVEGCTLQRPPKPSIFFGSARSGLIPPRPFL
jgi:hypothetical protein